MSYDRKRVQTVCETELLAQYGINLSVKDDVKKLASLSLTPTFFGALKSVLIDDVRDYYFKGILSLYEALVSYEERRFSWPTVKLYYSTYYFLRAEMLIRNTILIRPSNGGALYRLTLSSGNQFIKPNSKANNSDHKGTIYHFETLYKSVDPLLSNQINGVNSYDWMIASREQVNYKERIFNEPSSPSFWNGTNSLLKVSGSLDALLSIYINDNQYAYTFQNDHAILSIPLKRLLLTCDAFTTYGISSLLTNSQVDFINKSTTYPSINKYLLI